MGIHGPEMSQSLRCTTMDTALCHCRYATAPVEKRCVVAGDQWVCECVSVAFILDTIIPLMLLSDSELEETRTDLPASSCSYSAV